ncbi:deoxyuridine 5'-triphosphate nucleotidohydrolase, partial [Bacillus thuringiensis]
MDGRYFNKTAGYTYLIRKGDRIAQGVLAAVGHTTFEEVDDLSKSERGVDGFGSTGIQL